ncbi:Protein kinase of the Mitotic Exit Network [Cryptotrichosporon argae]
MLASSQPQPQPPHLLARAGMDSAAPATSRGALKSLLSRARSPEPSSARSKLRSLLDGPGSARAPVPPRLVAQRSPSPDGRRAIRFAPNALPALQRGDDGKWQPPSLSKGSMSTSALAELADTDQPTSPSHKKAKHSLSVLFQAKRTLKGKPLDPARPPSPLTESRPMQSPMSPTFQVTTAQGPTRSTRRAAAGAEPPRAAAPPVRSPIASPPGSPRTPTHSRLASSMSQLPREHYLVRLSTSYIVKTLTPVIRAPGFMASDKAADVRHLADERLTALGRMERGWGGEWARAAAAGAPDDKSSESRVRAVFVGDAAKARERKVWVEALRDGVLLCFLVNHLFPATPPRIPKVNVTETGLANSINFSRFVAALDAVGLPETDACALGDMDGSEDGTGRVAHAVIALARLAGPNSVAQSSPQIESRSSSLATHARSPSGVATPRTPRLASRPPSRQAGSGAAMPLACSPTSSRPTSPSHTGSRATSPAARRVTPSRRNIDSPSTNDLHAKLKLVADTPTHSKFPSTSSGSGPESPPRPAAMARSITQPAPSSPTRPHANRAISSSPTRHTSVTAAPALAPVPLTSSPGRLTMRSSPSRPVLRPRQLGSRASVSFASDASGSTHGHGHGHARERTPSLVSTGSRVTSSAYTRSSAALSISTVLCDDNVAIDLADDDDDQHDHVYRERRMSEKTLHEARRRIIGTLLAHDEPDVDARELAISASLAALEGTGAGAGVKDRPRPNPRRNLSEGRDVGRVDEEDEQEPPVRPRLVRNPSSGKNKFFIPKRSMSPASPNDGSSPTPSPTANMFAVPRVPMPTKKERRRSDGSALSQGADVAAAVGVASGAARNHSMVNLPSGRPHNPREASRDSFSLAKGSLTSQILEIAEAGRLPVRYQVGNCIGRGQFGSVYRSLNLGTGQMVAIKRIRLSGMKEKEVRDVMREVELLRRLSHPSIVKYEGMSRDDEYLNIVLEFVENGSLGQTLKAFGVFPEKLVSSYVAKILEGLDYLHSQGVVHCDLKAANILSTKNGNIKLSDFGVSLNMRAVEDMAHEAGTKGRDGGSDIAGTPNWMAPEVIKLAGASPASDIWSLGCTIIELLTGRPPYADVGNSMSVLFRIVEDDMPPLPEGMSAPLQDFMQLCFTKEPQDRPTAARLFEHEWVQAGNPEINLRPMDSVPFLRRVSQDLRRVDSQRIFSEGASAPSPPLPPDGRYSYGGAASAHGSSANLAPYAYAHGNGSGVYSASGGVYGASASSGPYGHAGPWKSQPPSTTDLPAEERRARARWSASSLHVREGSGAERKHAMVKTTFAKAITCRVCHEPVRKVGVLCQHCGLIAHAKCSAQATVRCDAREQLALLAARQEAAEQYAAMRASALSLDRSLSPTLTLSANSRAADSDVDADGDDDGDEPGLGLTRVPHRLFSGLKRSRTFLAHRSSSQLDIARAGAASPRALSPHATQSAATARTGLALSPPPLREVTDTAGTAGTEPGPGAGALDAEHAQGRPMPGSARSHASAAAYADAASADLVTPQHTGAMQPALTEQTRAVHGGRAPHGRRGSKSDCVIM